ncbi:hypothetical protein SNEBB_000346, partial [Seison nebaliae]
MTQFREEYLTEICCELEAKYKIRLAKQCSIKRYKAKIREQKNELGELDLLRRNIESLVNNKKENEKNLTQILEKLKSERMNSLYKNYRTNVDEMNEEVENFLKEIESMGKEFEDNPKLLEEIRKDINIIRQSVLNWQQLSCTRLENIYLTRKEILESLSKSWLPSHPKSIDSRISIPKRQRVKFDSRTFKVHTPSESILINTNNDDEKKDELERDGKKLEVISHILSPLQDEHENFPENDNECMEVDDSGGDRTIMEEKDKNDENDEQFENSPIKSIHDESFIEGA